MLILTLFLMQRVKAGEEICKLFLKLICYYDGGNLLKQINLLGNSFMDGTVIMQIEQTLLFHLIPYK